MKRLLTYISPIDIGLHVLGPLTSEGTLSASQKVRTIVCMCDPAQVKLEDMMQFHIDASGKFLRLMTQACRHPH